jgi:hypothetical protein
MAHYECSHCGEVGCFGTCPEAKQAREAIAATVPTASIVRPSAFPKPAEPAPVKSDGGSSAYYEVTIQRRDGQRFTCQTGDIIRALVANDFDLGNIIKAARRVSQSLQGKGKAGTSIAYDLNKIEYHLNEIRSFNNAVC